MTEAQLGMRVTPNRNSVPSPTPPSEITTSAAALEEEATPCQVSVHLGSGCGQGSDNPLETARKEAGRGKRAARGLLSSLSLAEESQK